MDVEGTARSRERQGSRSPFAPPFRALNWSHAPQSSAGCWSPWPAPPAGACWPSTGARRSAPPGWCWPPSAPTSSPIRFYSRFLADRGLRPQRPPGHARPSAWPTAATSCRPPAGCSSATTSPRSPAPGRWSGPVLAAQFGYLPGHHLDRLRRGARRRGAGLRHPLRLHAARRQVAGPDGQGGDRTDHRHARHGRGARDHGDPARRCSRWWWSTRCKDSPWGVFTILCTIPIAILMGFWMKVWRPGRTLEASVVGVVLLLLALVGGRYVAESPTLAPLFTCVRADHRLRHDRLRLHRQRAAGVDAALPAGLSLDLHEDRDHPPAGARHPAGAAAAPACRR